MNHPSFLSNRYKYRVAVTKFLEWINRHQRGLLWLAIFSFYLVSATLDVYTTNPGSRFMLTKNFARYFRFWIDPADRDYYSSLDYAEYNGKIYSDKPPLLAMLAVPLYWLGMIISWVLVGPQASSWDQDLFAKILIALGMIAFNSVAMLRIHDILETLGYSKSTRFITTISISFGSLFFPYAHTFFSHDVVGSFLIVATYHLLRVRRLAHADAGHRGRLLHSVAAGLFLGFAIGSDYFILFVIPLFYLFSLNIDRLLIRRTFSTVLQELVQFLLITVPIFSCGLFILWYNWINFGNPFTTAYEYVPIFVNFQHFLNPMTTGIEIMLFSNAHGLFLFTPLMFLALMAIPFSLRRHSRLTVLSVSIFLMLVLYYGKYWKPDGGLNYGIRFLLPAVPLFMINMASLLEELHELRNPFKWPIYLVFAIPSFVFSLAGGWISIFPSGGEGMQNPLFGDASGDGHVQRFQRFITTLLNFQVLLDLLLDRPFPGETSSSLLRFFPLLGFLALAIFLTTFLLTVVSYLFISHPDVKQDDHAIYKNEDSKTSEKNGDNNTLSDRMKLLLDMILVLVNGVYVVVFLLIHVHFLSKELSTVPDVQERFQIYPEDLQVIFLVMGLYIMLAVLLVLVNHSKKMNDWSIMRILGVTSLALWLITFIPPLDSIIIDPEKHVSIFFLIFYHWGLGLTFLFLLGLSWETMAPFVTTIMSKYDKLRNFTSFKMNERLLDHFVQSFAWLMMALLTLFVFGRISGFIFFVTFYLYTVGIFDIAGFTWNVAILIEIIGLVHLGNAIARTIFSIITTRRSARALDKRKQLLLHD